MWVVVLAAYALARDFEPRWDGLLRRPWTAMTSPREVALLRLAAQRVVGPPFSSPVGAVRWLTAMQAQNYAGALTSVALRSRSRARVDVEAALDAGDVVRSWPMRGTLHLVVADDLPWMLRLLAPRVVSASRGRRTGLGLTDAQLELAREVTVAALSAAGRLRRADLFAAWDDAGLATTGQRGVHILGFLAMTGTVVLGPTHGNEQLLVLTETWIRHPRHLEHDEALGELALRYFRSHGPATSADLKRWGNLVAADVRIGLDLARPQLLNLDINGTEHFMDPQTPDVLHAARAEAMGVHLLPGFDEFVLGYGDRAAQLDPAHADLVVPGGNGMFKSTVVSEGQIVGTWSKAGRGANQPIEATPFTSFTTRVSAALPQLYAALP